jgi:uncharacterized protein
MTRILSIDGGGIRGVIPAMVLAAIERETGKPIAKLFDVVAGTSTGGILACGLAAPGDDGTPRFSAAQLVDMYVNEGHNIFPHSIFQAATSLVHEKYPASGIEGVLRKYVGDAPLSTTVTEIFVTAYDIEHRKPVFFRTQDAKTDAARDHPLWMVARATSAAPTYFEPYRLEVAAGGFDALVDGGVFANNPAMCAYVDGAVGRARADDVLLVSLGTGSQIRRIEYEEAKNWGVVGWARPILDVVFDGVSDTTDYELQQILGAGRYHRLQTDMTIASDSMDDASPANMEKLQEQGQKLLDDTEDELAAICLRLTSVSA